MAHEGSFIGKDDTLYDYEVVDWRQVGSEDKYETGENLTETRLHTAEEVVVRVENNETGEVLYETIMGPFEEWEFVDEILEYDFGEGGSRA